MEDIILSIVAKLAEYTVGPILHHARYLCCFNNFAGYLPNAKEELELTRNSVKERVEEAIKRTEKIEPSVEKWLEDVEKVLEEVHMLEGEISDVSKTYFRRQCQYFLTKKIKIKIEKMAQLNRDSKFEPFSKIAELPGMKYYSSKDFILFKSTESTYKKLLDALKDKSVCMIGLVGLGGSGKTTLAKEVGKKAEELKLFEKVVMATVSQTPNIRSIQKQIAEKLGWEFKEETEEGRAQRLSERLRRGTTLLILDDVWEKLDFEAIGIPYNENNTGSGVLLTTRSREVCISMQCQTIIKLDLLSGAEAWTLFKLNANISDESPYVLKGVARKVVNECKGLPVAIVTVGSTLKGKTFKEWELALSRLEDSEPLDIPKGLRSPYVCLRLSYDNLTNELAKSLFLLCSIFPEDHEIDLEILFRFGKGTGLTGTFGTMEKARREMQIAVSILIDSYLLLQTSKKERVKMHDMVRDVALWIASKSGQANLTSTGMDPRMLVEDETVKDKRAISLWDLKNGQLLDDDQLPDDPLNCPTLEILLLHSENVGFEVSNACLERFKMLKILAFLTSSYYWRQWRTNHTLSLPQSMESLQNLHTLCLRGYKLGDISILESLKALEILDLRGSSFKELPNGIASLKKLKLLDLFCCGIEKDNAYEVIGGCLQLEELYVYLIQYKKNFPHNVIFPRLRRYGIIQYSSKVVSNLFLSYRWWIGLLEEHRPTRVLRIDGFDVSVQSFISLPIKDFFQKVEYLHLTYLKGGYKNIIPSMDPQGMNQLQRLYLSYCPEIECLFDSSNVDLLQTEDAFSSLVFLSLYRLENLEEVFRDPSSRCSLKNLEDLTIFGCPTLTCIFKPSIVQTQEGTVDYVSSQSHTSFMLPKLRRLHIQRCERLEYIFPVCFAAGLVNLESLCIRNCNALKYDILFLSDLQQDSTATENEVLCLVTTTFNQLSDQVLKFRELKLSGVGVKGIFQFQIREDASNRELAAPLNLDLTHVELRDLLELEFIWKGPTKFLSLHMLDKIYVDGCPKLKTIFSPTIVSSLPMLNALRISDCEELEQIFDSGDAQSLYTCSQQVCFPNLDSIEVRMCNKLKYLFHNFVVGQFNNLTHLTIKDCSQLQKVFAFECETEDDGQEEIVKDGEKVLLHNLQFITLCNLPNFKEIHHEFKLKDHVDHDISDCPKYSPSLYLHTE